MFPDWSESSCSFLCRCCCLKKFPISGATSLSRCSLTASSMLLKLFSSSFGVLFNSMAAAAFRWSFKTLLSSGVISFLYLASFSFSHMTPISRNTHCVSEMLPNLPFQYLEDVNNSVVVNALGFAIGGAFPTFTFASLINSPHSGPPKRGILLATSWYPK